MLSSSFLQTLTISVALFAVKGLDTIRKKNSTTFPASFQPPSVSTSVLLNLTQMQAEAHSWTQQSDRGRVRLAHRCFPTAVASERCPCFNVSNKMFQRFADVPDTHHGDLYIHPLTLDVFGKALTKRLESVNHLFELLIHLLQLQLFLGIDLGQILFHL